MHVMTKYPEGVFSWVDLASTDVDAAKAFFSGLFGWSYVDLPTPMGNDYTMCQIDGKNVAGLSAMPPMLQAQGVPSFWTSYVNHSDVDAIAAKITAAGGQVMMPPMDVMESGRMLVATDPEGAQFGVWQPNQHIGAQLCNVPNTLVWNELATRDSAVASEFYTAVFDWTITADESGYGMISADSRRQAGMMSMDENWGGIPAYWGVYFLVEDADATATKAVELGGTIINGPFDAGEVGKIVILTDPAGGMFSAIQSNVVDAPPGA